MPLFIKNNKNNTTVPNSVVVVNNTTVPNSVVVGSTQEIFFRKNEIYYLYMHMFNDSLNN